MQLTWAQASAYGVAAGQWQLLMVQGGINGRAMIRRRATRQLGPVQGHSEHRMLYQMGRGMGAERVAAAVALVIVSAILWVAPAGCNQQGVSGLRRLLDDKAYFVGIPLPTQSKRNAARLSALLC